MKATTFLLVVVLVFTVVVEMTATVSRGLEQGTFDKKEEEERVHVSSIWGKRAPKHTPVVRPPGLPRIPRPPPPRVVKPPGLPKPKPKPKSKSGRPF